MLYAYPCTLVPEDEGGFFVSFPDVPEALTGGGDRLETLRMAALRAALWGLRQRVPMRLAPSRITP